MVIDSRSGVKVTQPAYRATGFVIKRSLLVPPRANCVLENHCAALVSGAAWFATGGRSSYNAVELRRAEASSWHV
jgi:hypothetical protein